MNNLAMLAQVIIEDKYSRHNIREAVMMDMQDSNIEGLIAHGIKLIEEYINGSYYTSKQKRIGQFASDVTVNINELIIEVMVCVMSTAGPQNIQSIISRLIQFTGLTDELAAIKTSAELIAVLSNTGMYKIIAAKDSESGSLMVIANYSLEEETLQYLANTKYLPPLVCVPNTITSNFSSGYLTKRDSIILGTGNHHDHKQALDVINIMNRIELTLDEDVMADEETSKKELDTKEKEINFERMVKSSQIVYKELMESGNTFYLTHKFDKRGRLYSQGYHVNIQGTSYKKALINLSKLEIITGD